MKNKERIWLFGDSYGDLKSKINKNNFSWVEGLSKKYEVKNFCECGSGIDYSLNLLNEKIRINELLDLRNTNLIFIIPEVFRFNFSFFKKPNDQVYCKHLVRTDDLNYDEKTNQEIIRYREKYSEFVINFFRYYIFSESDYFIKSIFLKTIGNIHLYNNLFKSILCFCVKIPQDTILNKIGLDVINDKNFYFFNHSLIDISMNEGDDFDMRLGYETRNHHLNNFNNYVMYDLVCNWIDKRIIINENIFSKK